MTAAVLLLTCLSASNGPVEVTLFGSNSDAQLTAAITAQLTDLEVVLETVRETEPWESTEAGQLRQVRRLLFGKRTRVAIWVETVPWRVHVADVWTGRHVQRDLVIDSGGREAAALMVRSAVASFVEQDAEPPSSVLHDERFRLSALWHATKWAAAVPWAQGPVVEASWVFSAPFSLTGWGRFELPTTFTDELVRVDFQRNEVGLGVDWALHLGRLTLRPRVGFAMRFVRVTPRAIAEGVDPTPPGTDVGVVALVGTTLALRLVGPLDLVLEGWGDIALRDTRYQIQKVDQSITALQTWRFEGGAALGVCARF